MDAATYSSIVWTAVKPAYQSVDCNYSSTDIGAIQSWIERERDLGKMRRRDDDWDGFGSSAPDGAVLDKADFFLRILRERDAENPPMRLALSSDGSVAFEWLDGASFVRAEIEDTDEVEWMVVVPGQPTEFVTESLQSLWESGSHEWEPEPSPVGNFAYASGF